MKLFSNIWTRLDDAMNPVVIKELRQAVAGKFVTSVIAIFLVVEMFVIGVHLFDASPDRLHAGIGGNVFFVLQTILIGSCLLFLPAFAALRMHSERGGVNIDLFYITTVSAWKIVWGKFLSAFVIAVLIFAVCTPFVSLSFLLRGIDLPTILTVTLFNLVGIGGAVMLAIFLAALSTNRVIKSLLFLGGIVAMIIIGGWMVALIQAVQFRGAFVAIASMIVGPGAIGNIWLQFAGMLFFIIMFMGVMFMVASALLTPPSSNRAYPVRIYMTVAWFVLFLMALCMSVNANFTMFPVQVWAVITTIMFPFVMFSAICERDRLGPRVRHEIPRSRLARIPAFLFYSGSTGGILWACMIVGLTWLMALKWDQMFGSGLVSGTSSDFGPASVMRTFTLYTLVYCLSALVLRKTLFKRIVVPELTWALALLMMLLGTAFPYILALLMKVNYIDIHSPFYATVAFRELDWNADSTIIWLLVIWAGVAGAFLAPSFVESMARFRRTPRSRGPVVTDEHEVNRQYQNLKVFQDSNPSNRTMFGVADDQIFYVELWDDQWEEAGQTIQTGQLPYPAYTHAGRLLRASEILYVHAPKRRRTISITWNHGGRPSTFKIVAPDVKTRDQFVTLVSERVELSDGKILVSLTRLVSWPIAIAAAALLIATFSYLGLEIYLKNTGRLLTDSGSVWQFMTLVIIGAAVWLGWRLWVPPKRRVLQTAAGQAADH